MRRLRHAFVIIDLKSLRDIGLAVLLVLPAVMLARPPAHAPNFAADQRFDLSR